MTDQVTDAEYIEACCIYPALLPQVVKHNRRLKSIAARLRTLSEPFPERFGCNGPEGTFWTDDSALANKLISATFDRDEWTVTDMHNPTGKALSEQQGEAVAYRHFVPCEHTPGYWVVTIARTGNRGEEPLYTQPAAAADACFVCKGSGEVAGTIPHPNGDPQCVADGMVPCPRCNGTGENHTPAAGDVSDELAAWRELADHVRTGTPTWPGRYTDARTRDVATFIREHQDRSGSAVSAPAAGDFGAGDFAAYLRECDRLAIQPDTAGAFHAGWKAALSAAPAPVVPEGWRARVETVAHNLGEALEGCSDHASSIAAITPYIDELFQIAAPQAEGNGHVG